MKKLLGLGLLSLLLSGCHTSEGPIRRHEIVCRDVVSKVQTFDVESITNVYAFVVAGHSVLAYYTEGNKQIQVIFLSKNDCEVY